MEIIQKGCYTYYVYQGYVYILRKLMGSLKTYFRCNRYRSTKYPECKGVLIWDSTRNRYDVTKPHNHPSPEERLDKIRVRAKLVDVIHKSTITSTTRDVISEATSILPEGAQIDKVEAQNLKRAAMRYKNIYRHISQLGQSYNIPVKPIFKKVEEEAANLKIKEKTKESPKESTVVLQENSKQVKVTTSPSDNAIIKSEEPKGLLKVIKTEVVDENDIPM